MNLLVKIYMKRHVRHNKTLYTTDFFTLCSVLYLIKFHILILSKVVTDPNLTCMLLKKTNKQKQNKKKPLKKPAFRSGLPICHKLWDIDFFSFSLIHISIQRGISHFFISTDIDFMLLQIFISCRELLSIMYYNILLYNTNERKRRSGISLIKYKTTIKFLVSSQSSVFHWAHFLL